MKAVQEDHIFETADYEGIPVVLSKSTWHSKNVHQPFSLL